MVSALRNYGSNTYKLVAHSLSGRLLLLTLVFVMVMQGVIFLPVIASYYVNLLEQHIESAEVAILPFTELADASLSARLRGELLARAGASAVMLKRPEQRELFLVTEMPPKIDVSVDLGKIGFFGEIWAALRCLLSAGNPVLHIIAPTRIAGAQTVEVVLGEAPIRAVLAIYAWRILWLALFVSLTTAVLVFVSLYLSLVEPMRRIAAAMIAFRSNPEDASRIVIASARRDEIGIVERELAAMQRELYHFLQQKGRLAALGIAVAKIQHDLRNILSSAQLTSDRLSDSQDPVVKQLAPRLVASIGHAIALATNTLHYGRAAEAPPQRQMILLTPLIGEAIDAVQANIGTKTVCFTTDISPDLQADADPEQLYRILLNLLRNAAEAVAEGGTICIFGQRQAKTLVIEIADNGPGIPTAAAGRLFQPFAGRARTGGTGLGLAISRELARGHGGDLVLVHTGTNGTRFRIDLPDRRH